MKQLSYIFFLILLFPAQVGAQCTNWEEIDFDSFEYSTTCPYILPGTTYQTSPQMSPGFGPNYSGNYHVYLNFVNGYVGPAFSRPYTVCIGQTYRISFYHRDAWGGQNNTTFNVYDGNGVLLNSSVVPWTGTTWNFYQTPEILATTTTLRLEIVNNSAALGNNDMVVDDMRLQVCSMDEQVSYTMCTQNGTMDLYTLFSANMPTGGTWSGPSTLANGDLGTFDPQVNASGLYTYTVPPQAPCATPVGTVLISSIPNVDLGPDQMLCQGQSAILDAGPGYDFYSWSTGASTQSINVTASGTYSVSVGAMGSNLVINGDFESGNTGFSTDYVVGTGGAWGPLSNEGTYLITTSPSLAHSNFMPCSDITSGAGNMLVVNGSGTPNSNVWCQTIAVDPFTDYVFSAWITNALNDPNVANLQFFVNGVQIGSVFSTATTGCNWAQFNDMWSSNGNTTANICIVNQNTTVGGNDFAIDDIFFAPICALSDTVVIAYDPISVDAGADLNFCATDPELIVATTNDPNANISWNSGQSTLSFEPTSSGVYTITATSQNGCIAQDDVSVTVVPVDWTIDNVSSLPADCGINNGQVSVTTSGPFPGTPNYQWSGPGAGSTNTFNGTTWNNLGPGWYYLSVESSGCYQYDSVEVTQNAAPLASGNVSPVYGVAPLNVNFENFSQNASSYQWSFGNDSTLFTSTLDPISLTYNSAGVYTVMLIANEGACADTIYFTVTVVDPPLEIPFSYSVPNVFTPNSDGENDLFYITMENASDLEIVVVNRWGNTVAVGNDTGFFWDGNSNGQPAAEGDYFFRYTITPIDGEVVQGQGFVHLIR